MKKLSTKYVRIAGAVALVAVAATAADKALDVHASDSAITWSHLLLDWYVPLGLSAFVLAALGMMLQLSNRWGVLTETIRKSMEEVDRIFSTQQAEREEQREVNRQLKSRDEALDGRVSMLERERDRPGVHNGD